MRKYVLAFSVFTSLFIGSVQVYAGSCVDLNYGLARKDESPAVLSLQNFLYEKGFLTATPNGYFGPSTLAAVKAYQKSLGYEQAGNVGPLTRDALRRDTCTSNVQTTSPTANKPTTTSVAQAALPTTASTYSTSCVDLKYGLAYKDESSEVLALQNFLYKKGYLTAAPNGYFGPATLAGVKAYQQSIGQEQAGNVGPLTRAALRKDTCTIIGQTVSTAKTTNSNGTAATNNTVTTTTNVATVSTPTVPVVNTPTGLRNAKRREDLEKLIKALFARYRDTRGAHSVQVTETPIELCVVPPYVPSTATATEVAVYTSPVSPCADFVDITYLSPNYLSWIPRDPSIATSSTLTGYTITRSDSNQITLEAKSPEDKAIIKVTCNFNGYCQDFKHISTVQYGAPVFASSSRSILIRDTWPVDPLVFYGKNFTATNTVTLLSKYTAKKYVLGTFTSTNGTSLPITSSSTNQEFSCGGSCVEKLPLGEYSFTITNEGGVSNTGYLTFKGITTSTFSSHGNTSVIPNSTDVKIGSVTISAGIPIKLKALAITLATTTSKDLPGKISTFVLKDSIENLTYSGPTFSLGNKEMYENQSKVYDVYVNVAQVDTYQSGYISYGGMFTITDVLTGADMNLPIKEMMFTVSY